jgi:hypothetical protein
LTTQTECGIFQCMLFLGPGCAIMHGIATSERFPEFLPIFRSMAATFRTVGSDSSPRASSLETPGQLGDVPTN